MKPAAYPFSAIVGQSEMKLALLLAAVDWRLGVLLRGDKGSGKTTTARGLAALLPASARFINLPLGATEDRLLGGLDLARTLKGDPVLKPGLLAEAHGGVLYVDEVNLLPAHLGDALLDAVASGVHVVEREGLSVTHPAEFVLLGSMNPEEGSLHPQLLDRFALSVTVCAPLDPAERQLVIERRIAFERHPAQFASEWSQAQQTLKSQITSARATLGDIACSSGMMGKISSTICEYGIRSLRADLAVLRAAITYAALTGDVNVEIQHVEAVLPLVLAHRTRAGGRSSFTPPPPPTQPQQSESESQAKTGEQDAQQRAHERIFTASEVKTPALDSRFSLGVKQGGGASADGSDCGPIIGNRQADFPVEFDLRATLSHTLRETGGLQPRVEDLHERVRKPRTGTRYLFVVDSSGSHAVQQRMRIVKGAISSMLTRSFKRGDEVVMIVFRGTSAQVILEPTQVLSDALDTLDYLPTGGRTPLAAALNKARGYLTPTTLLILLTDGRANIPLNGGDPWQEALDAAQRMSCDAIIVDTETATQRLGQCKELATVLAARYVPLEELTQSEKFLIAGEQLKPRVQEA
ncbi:ATP-binding protein [Terracidiphilus sp.]|uniref:ATP-binding protein n=1 Tax=Terracidiphilus sp. TaxID=1964191 RepID=UPI003C27FAE9